MMRASCSRSCMDSNSGILIRIHVCKWDAWRRMDGHSLGGVL